MFRVPKRKFSLYSGKALAERLRFQVKEEMQAIQKKNNLKPPCFANIWFGDKNSYVQQKQKACQSLGIDHKGIQLDLNSSQSDLLSNIRRLNTDNDINGIIIQLPLPKQINLQQAVNEVSPIKDVDGFNAINVQAIPFKQFNPLFIPATPLAVLTILNDLQVDIKGKQVAILGRSLVVGTPLALLLMRHDATVTICHSLTQREEKILKESDIIVSATGVKNLVKHHMVSEGQIIIDVGITREIVIDSNTNQQKVKLRGDVDQKCQEIAKIVTSVPAGVGPVTVACLMSNVLKAWKYQNGLIQH